MKCNVKDGYLTIYKDNHISKINLLNINNLINDPILQFLTLEELNRIWKCLKIIPNNIKDYLLTLIKYYDKSEQIDSFIYKNKNYWFDKNTRTSLLTLAQYSEKTITLVLGDEIVILDTYIAKDFLRNLELYASKCFLTTAQHLKNVKELKKLEDIINYDYTYGYPNKLNLNEYLDLA